MWRSFLLVCALVAVGAMGTDARDGEGTFESPRELPDSIVVTANRFGVSEARSVWPTSVIEFDEQSGPDLSLHSKLEGAAGVDIRNYNGMGSVSTLSNWGVFNRHMLLLYNGRPVKDYSLGGFNLAEFSPNELQRVEMVKGPQSAFYGSDAVGGVVNLITPTALADRIRVKTRAGSFDSQNYFVHASRRRGDFGIGTWVDYATTDNRRDNAGSERFIAGFRSDYLMGDHRVSLTARYLNDSLGVPGPVPALGEVPVYGSREASSLNARQEDENYSLDLQYHFVSESAGEVQVDLFWEKKNLDYNDLYNYQFSYWTVDTMVNPPDSMSNTDSVDVQSRTAYVKRSSGITGRYMREVGAMSLAGGVDYLSGSMRATTDDLNEATNVEGPFAPYSYDYVTFNYWAAGQDQVDVWGNARWSLLEELRADVSGRVQFVKGRESQPSYNLGLIFQPVSSVRLKIGYAYAFRLPTIAEQFADDVFTAGNANLNSETAHTLQGTVAFKSDDVPVSASATVFRQEIDSLIQYRYDPEIFRSVPRNFERFESTGLDATIAVRLPHDAALRVNGVWQEAEQSSENGERFEDAPYVPNLKWRADLTAKRGRFNGGVNLTYTSERSIIMFGGMQKTIDRVYELGVVAGVQLTDNVRLQLTGHDLADARRADQFGFTLQDGDYPGLGRRFLVELDLSLL